MKVIKKLLAAAGVLMLGMLACNMPSNVTVQPAPPGGQPSGSNQVDLNSALTLAVQTIQAAAPTATLAPPTPTTVSVPSVTVSSVTNCRTGPSAAYDWVMTFQVGSTAEIVAKYSPANYWIIKYPGGGNATCWLWGQYATVVGDTSHLQEAVPPPLPLAAATSVPEASNSDGSGSAPNPPKSMGLSCTSVNKSHKSGLLLIISFQWTVNLTWKDNSDDEGGFYVYKDGSRVATLGPNSTSFTDQFNVGLAISGSNDHTYGVSSFNQAGESMMKTAGISTCP